MMIVACLLSAMAGGMIGFTAACLLVAAGRSDRELPHPEELRDYPLR